jgi:hypothetical protein
MVASMKMTAFSDIALCSLAEVDWRFSGAYCLYNQGDKLIIVLMMEQYPPLICR